MLDGRVEDLKTRALAASTRRTYATYLGTYLSFCDGLGIKVAPVSMGDLGRYIASLSFRMSFSSLRNYLSAVRYIHLELGFDNPLTCYTVPALLKGARRLLGDATSDNADILRGIVVNMNVQDPKDVRFWAVCLIAFFSFFRKPRRGRNLILPGTVVGIMWPLLRQELC